jgi:hypothetical protein
MKKVQLELEIERKPEQDRNFHLGGRSFYFFDFDDNVAFLATSLVLFHKNDGSEIEITSGDFAREQKKIGKSGVYKDFEINWDDVTGTFRHFRDHKKEELEHLGHQNQIFIQDVLLALGLPDLQWKGPSWSCFYHATFNQRPLSVITARGHSPETIQQGINLMVQAGHLPMAPNYLSVFPVNNPECRKHLGDAAKELSTAQLKQAAIRKSVERAIEVYGPSPHHRFGMSDDDPENIQLIKEEMGRLKSRFPNMSFFMIETLDNGFVKHEVTEPGSSEVVDAVQHPLFEDDSE